jgi:hypothetical protein
MPEGAALSWPFPDIVIRNKSGFDLGQIAQAYGKVNPRGEGIMTHLTIAFTAAVNVQGDRNA